jgi:hypothetical protein
MKYLIVAGTVALMLLATAGCSGSGVPARPASYLASSNSKVAFIQWRPTSHGHLRGTITEDSTGGSGSAQTLSVSSAPFTGTMSGNSVRLTFGTLYFLHANAHGTVNGSVLTMVVPASDGSVKQASFSSSNKAGYDRAIAALRNRIRHANLLAAKQLARQRRQPAHAQAEQGAQMALSAVGNDASLAGGGKLAVGLARFARHIQAGRSHLATERADSSGNNKYCAAAFTVAGDAKTVDGALQSVQGDTLNLISDISVIRLDIVMADAHLRHLSRAGLPAPVLASNVIASARANVKQAVAMANSYIDQINAIDTHARAIAAKMATGRCSGASSGSLQHPIPHVH